jgi:hypothetical protein
MAPNTGEISNFSPVIIVEAPTRKQERRKNDRKKKRTVAVC